MRSTILLPFRDAAGRSQVVTANVGHLFELVDSSLVRSEARVGLAFRVGLPRRWDAVANDKLLCSVMHCSSWRGRRSWSCAVAGAPSTTQVGPCSTPEPGDAWAAESNSALQPNLGCFGHVHCEVEPDLVLLHLHVAGMLPSTKQTVKGEAPSWHDRSAVGDFWSTHPAADFCTASTLRRRSLLLEPAQVPRGPAFAQSWFLRITLTRPGAHA
jgi:hypothetical protein